MLLNQIRSGKGVFLMAAKLRRQGIWADPSHCLFTPRGFQRGLERSATGHTSAPFQCPSRCPWLGIHSRDIRKRVDERAHTTKVVVWETTQTLCDFTLVNITTLVSLFFKEVEENALAFNFTHLCSCALKSHLRTKRHFQDGWCVSIIL